MALLYTRMCYPKTIFIGLTFKGRIYVQKILTIMHKMCISRDVITKGGEQYGKS
jgi:hypothetical protein